MIWIKHIDLMNVDTWGTDMFEDTNCILNGIPAFEMQFEFIMAI